MFETSGVGGEKGRKTYQKEEGFITDLIFLHKTITGLKNFSNAATDTRLASCHVDSLSVASAGSGRF